MNSQLKPRRASDTDTSARLGMSTEKVEEMRLAEPIICPRVRNTRRGPANAGPLRLRFHGAEDEIRTRDPHLGKVMLYH